ncbi:hypothetical protein EA462_12270 [Natrarchaeobius halalkaliphilus]|uniref:Uncharacterized protein n=1 Tax=Natrarchaeobius halalkaliphilus TaxID=1679091 RepID=A0A3N6M0I5_9EURY|nr:hypothetical protein [Natrarchaeobius halalkaliphilus]RQG89140.1 hypothetical protein EA462_12270 [Natrarchaeobius halalkaliphilus]
MTHSRLSRRGVVALAAVGLAGCTSSEDRNDDGGTNGGNTDDTNGSESDANGADERDSTDRDIEANWDEAAPFRTWLLDTDANRRFDYTEEFPADADPASGFPDVFGVSDGAIDAHLIQTGTHVFFGSFDSESIVDGVEAADEYDSAGQYEGYALLTQTLPDGQPQDIAIGSDVIVVGNDYERRIDAHRGERDRLEETDPEFTHLFRELPHETTVSGQYGSPTGANVDIDELHLWGVSSEFPTAETMTWVFVFEREEDLTGTALEELEGISSGVEDSSIDGRTATVVGAPPDIPEEVP